MGFQMHGIVSKLLKSDRIEYVSKVIHISDVHIRNYKRHDEYESVFDKLYTYCEDVVAKDNNTIIYVAGDVVHAKTDMSPELVRLTRQFLAELVRIAPVILIPGNHDCYTPDHEVLTKSGWISIGDYVNRGQIDSVATFDDNTRTIVFSKPSHLIKKEVNGELVHISGKNVDMLVTPNHRVIHHTASTDKFYVKSARDIHDNMYIPVNGIVTNYENNPLAELIGFTFADGTIITNFGRTRRIQFHLKKSRKIKYLCDLLDRNDYVYNINPQKNGSTYISVYGDLARTIHSFLGDDNRIDWSILNNDLNFLKSFILGYLSRGGGRVKDKNFYSFTDIDPMVVEILGTIMHMVGGVSRLKLEGSFNGNFENSKIQYSGDVTFSDRLKTTKVKSVDRVSYNGNVYCLTVDTSYLLIRRNGKIFISGNCNLNNSNRLDALSPIVDSIDSPDLFYLRDTGVYHFGGIDFVHNSVFTPPESYLTADDVEDGYTKVVLFHGVVDKAKTEQGIEMCNNKVTIGTFNGFDFGMFGDIHGFQYLDPNARFAYAGSLIQQNFGEGLTHGVILWDLIGKKSKFVKIENDWGYHTLDIDDSKFYNLPKTLSKFNRVRIRSYNTKNSDLMTLISKLKTDFKIEDIRVQKFTNKLSSTGTSNKVTLDDVRDIEFQNGLITSYIEAKYPVTADVLDEIRKINRRLNTQLSKTGVIRNIIWTPVLFEFSNMFSYGENNHIDFSQMSGTYGVFAANASGKSSLLDALMFCIFDKCSRTFKASEILNNKKDWLHCKFHFKLSGLDFFIERRGVKNKKGHVKINVNFWYEKDGDVISLNGDDRDGTNFAIRSYLGNYDDFIVTALSLQSNNTNFIDKQQRERKDLLAQFLDLNVFEELNSIAVDECKSIQTLINEFSKQDYSTKLADASRSLNENLLELDKHIAEKEEFVSNLDNCVKKILTATKTLKPVDMDIENLNISKLLTDKESLKSKLIGLNEELTILSTQQTTIENDVLLVESSLASLDTDSMDIRSGEYSSLIDSLNLIEIDISSLSKEIDHLNSKVLLLNDHEYDPNCKFCIENGFVRDALSAEKELPILEATLTQKIKSRDTIRMNISEYSSLLDDIKLKSKLDKDLSTLNQRRLDVERDIHSKQVSVSTIDMTISELDLKIKRYTDNESVINENQKVHLEIIELERSRDLMIDIVRDVESKIINTSGQIKLYEKMVSDCQDSMQKLNELERQYSVYSHYLTAVNRNGVPYELISSVLPKIQNEVNGILSQIVEFEILFETDGKSINTYIVYDDLNYWPLEMTSGMEKFISSLAIRTALINVSSLPRPNFIAIDEGFGVLDPDSLNSLHMFFDYLKTHFDFILTISHIDALRDIMDNSIDIKKEHGFSGIQY